MKLEICYTNNMNNPITNTNVNYDFQDGEFYIAISLGDGRILTIFIEPEDLQNMMNRWFEYSK